MRKLLLLSMITLFFVSCKSKSVTNTAVDNKTERMMKGDWTISSVSYIGSEYIKVQSFGLADSQCFEGSKWKLISNNNKGEMSLTKSDCMSFSSPISWFVNKEGQFVLKVLNAGEKAKKVRDGYILDVANQSENSFQLIDMVTIGGKSTNVVYQFQKN
ncbi:lipocalin family protein [Flavobacterium antarcticum]|uniref:lipocalin family protein n=1 Tax=Flavobacterium antarcticum TaxID=271155 RepID=UPI0003B398E1|nr:lipocalin family protein [Flavobacterium antarcticum]